MRRKLRHSQRAAQAETARLSELKSTQEQVQAKLELQQEQLTAEQRRVMQERQSRRRARRGNRGMGRVPEVEDEEEEEDQGGNASRVAAEAEAAQKKKLADQQAQMLKIQESIAAEQARLDKVAAERARLEAETAGLKEGRSKAENELEEIKRQAEVAKRRAEFKVRACNESEARMRRTLGRDSV